MLVSSVLKYNRKIFDNVNIDTSVPNTMKLVQENKHVHHILNYLSNKHIEFLMIDTNTHIRMSHQILWTKEIKTEHLHDNKVGHWICGHRTAGICQFLFVFFYLDVKTPLAAQSVENRRMSTKWTKT